MSDMINLNYKNQDEKQCFKIIDKGNEHTKITLYCSS